MKRILPAFIIISGLLLGALQSTSGQENKTEKKSEKRVKVTIVKDNGQKIEIDTLITGEGNIKKIITEDGMKWTIYSNEDGEKTLNLHKIGKDDSGNIYISTTNEEDLEDGKFITTTVRVVDGDTVVNDTRIELKEGGMVIAKPAAGVKSMSGEAYMFIGTNEEGEERSIIKVGKAGDAVLTARSSDLEEGESEIIIRSADGEEVIRIKGNAVIRIVDGKVTIEGSGNKPGEASKEAKSDVKAKKKNQ